MIPIITEYDEDAEDFVPVESADEDASLEIAIDRMIEN